jgi:hypothetical protein
MAQPINPLSTVDGSTLKVRASGEVYSEGATGTTTAILKGNGAGGFTAAIPGVDYVYNIADSGGVLIAGDTMEGTLKGVASDTGTDRFYNIHVGTSAPADTSMLWVDTSA